MKRMTALVLALLLLLSFAAACGESVGSRLRLSKIQVSSIGGKSEKVKLKGIVLYVAFGSVEGLPTVQATLDYGDNQELDFVAQLEGSRLLLGMGSIGGTYYVDLEEALGPTGALTAAAAGSVIQMLGENPDMTLDMLLPKNKKGTHVWKVEVPDPIRGALEQNLWAMLSDGEEPVPEEADGKRKPLVLDIRYRPKGKKFWIYLRKGKGGLKIYARTKMVTEPMTFINLTADESQYNILSLDETVLAELQGELGLLSMKADHFIQSKHLDEWMK